jgi:gliding motility-associated peptidyl-prolyl isomerase
MLKSHYILIFTIILVVLFSSCENDVKQQGQRGFDKREVDKVLAKMNKEYIDVENQQIDDYLNRRKWNFKKTKSGLRYYIYKEGVGQTPISGSTVSIEYEISLIRGEVVYSSKELGPKVFVVDKSEEPSGLHEAMKLMKVGGKAMLVIPSYLAYGLLGDENKIPKKATLFYNVYLKEVKN